MLEAWEVSQQSKRRSANKVWRSIAAAAAVVVVVLLLTVPDVCGEENIIQLVGRWTGSIFSFEKIQEGEFVYQTDHPGLQELYDTVTALGVEKNVVPTWMPDGYKLEQIKTAAREDNITVFAIFVCGEDQIIINVNIFDSARSGEYQKEVSGMEVLEKNSIKHYIMKNNAVWSAAWINNNAECVISTKNKETLDLLILSIY